MRLYEGDGTFHEATLLSTNGPVYDINGQIHLGHHGQLVLPALPDNLVAKPTLVWLLRNAADGPQRVEASYLTGGITWKADYVHGASTRPTTRADVTGWVTIDNKSGATYGNAALKLVAGDVNRAQDRGATRRVMELAAKAAAPRRRQPRLRRRRASSSTTSTRSTAAPRSRTTRPSSSR